MWRSSRLWRLVGGFAILIVDVHSRKAPNECFIHGPDLFNGLITTVGPALRTSIRAIVLWSVISHDQLCILKVS
jgi:hypothetical protein